MTPARRKRLAWVCALVVVAAMGVSLILYGLGQNLNYFYSPSEIAIGESPHDRPIRAGGVVVKGSLSRATDSLAVEFAITDFQHHIKVRYTGILPDLFREGQGVVVRGQMDGSTLVATEVLAKHDENYMPPEVKDALEDAKASMQSSTQSLVDP